MQATANSDGIHCSMWLSGTAEGFRRVLPEDPRVSQPYENTCPGTGWRGWNRLALTKVDRSGEVRLVTHIRRNWECLIWPLPMILRQPDRWFLG